MLNSVNDKMLRSHPTGKPAGFPAQNITDTKFGYQWCITNPEVMDYIARIDEEHITR